MGIVTATSTMLMLAAGANALGSIMQGQQAAQQAKFQASVYKQQAEQERKASEAEERDFRKRMSAQAGAARAAFGASGVSPSTGSPLLSAEDFGAETELQALRIREGGLMRANRMEQEAALTKAAGKSAQQRGFFRAGSSLLSGIGQAQNFG